MAEILSALLFYMVAAKCINQRDFHQHHKKSFIGLSEFPLLTEELYRRMFGFDEVESLKPFRKVRANPRNTEKTKSKLLTQLNSAKWRDPFDDALYDEVVRIFSERCANYNISLSGIDLSIDINADVRSTEPFFNSY